MITADAAVFQVKDWGGLRLTMETELLGDSVAAAMIQPNTLRGSRLQGMGDGKISFL
jgi:hypothetical protein